MDWGTQLQQIGPFAAVVCGALGFVWRQLSAKHKKTEEKLDQCEAKHEQHHADQLALTERVARLEGREEADAKAAEAVNRLSDDMIKMVGGIKEHLEKGRS